MSSVVQLFHKFVDKKALLIVCSRPETFRIVDGRQQTIETALGIQIPVTILDAREAYGREHVLVHPHQGVGTVWVEVSDKLRVVDEWPEENAEEDQPDEDQADDDGTTD